MNRVGTPVAATLALALAATVSFAGTSYGLEPHPNATAASASASLLDSTWGDVKANQDGKATTSTGVWDPKSDLGSMYNLTKSIGAQDAWRMTDAQGQPVTGKGVTVALVDTGIAPVAGLDSAGKVINGPDLSFDGQSDATRYLDAYGHGTHMAGIIAGRDDTVTTGKLNDPTQFVGVAPDAKLLNVRVSSSDGSTDVSQVIAAIDWIVQHRHDNGMNVRVLNLSYGTNSRQSYEVDPLAKAVENAWAAGIVVVAASGNDGASTPLTMPAADPYILAVGSSDNQGTATTADDTLSSFTNTGDASRHSDLLAPGKSIVSLRDPGSYVDVHHPEGLVAGDTSGRLFRGSGTSQAAAVVSGAVALLLQAHPNLSPDQVKALLESSANPMPAESSVARGAGELNIGRALELPTPSAGTVAQTYPTSTGLGALELSRGDTHVVDNATGTVLAGEVDAFGAPWDGARWAAASTLGTAWMGGQWNSTRWSGDTWTSAGWASPCWSSTRWSDAEWSSTRWSSTRWSSTRWSDAAWLSTRWSSTRWSSTRWSDAAWLSTRWSSTRWSSTRWSSTRWSDADWSSTRWSSTRWSDADWSSTRWSSTRWSDADWSSTRWSSTRWSDADWSSTRWSASSWGV
ncbi:serine protease AprX [mine drainage metagenome]|uniref:Serine protease AprX n=1 Tax=mine drainage metagenome TaxID=410659 RepID=A0A1J5RI34_9ZZZZ